MPESSPELGAAITAAFMRLYPLRHELRRLSAPSLIASNVVALSGVVLNELEPSPLHQAAHAFLNAYSAALHHAAGIEADHG